MKIINKKLIIALLGIAVTTSSCRFSDECTYTGYVDIRVDWDLLWGNMIKPDTLTTIFFKEGAKPLEKGLYGDTIYTDIPAGYSDIFVYNHSNNLQLRGFETINNAELHLPTYFKGNTRIVGESPMICTFSNNVDVPIDGVAKKDISPIPIVKELRFATTVIRKGITGEVIECKASLSGIPTGYSLATKEALRNKATVLFTLAKEKEDFFSHRFYVLGVNPTLPGEEVIPNKLTLTVLLSDGISRSVEVDITDKLDKFNTNIFECKIEVIISAVSSSVSVVQWEQSNSGDIIIQ